MKLSVVIPSYRRPRDLERCLESLARQTRPADEIIVVARTDDHETWKAAAIIKDRLHLPVHLIPVGVPGQVAALNTGLETCTGDVVAITDDDAMPWPDWLQRIEAWFLQDEHLGGVGGRDWVHENGHREEGARERVGIVKWFGRVIGNHHLGVGQAREVDVLKGANMSFRRTAIQGLRFDAMLRGTGAQVHNDMDFSLEVRRRGWRLLYDPRVAINHFPSQRHDENQRRQFSFVAFSQAVHNETWVLMKHLSPLKRSVFVCWAFAVGTRDAFGLVQWLRFLPRDARLATAKLAASLHGRISGLRTWLQYKS